MDENIAIEIVKKNIRSSFVAEKVLEHTTLVKDISTSIAKKINSNGTYFRKIDLNIIKISAILHDIGREKNPPGTLHSLRHNISGQKIIEKEISMREKRLNGTNDQKTRSDLNDEISILKICSKVCKTHICVGFTEKEVKKYKLDLPENDYTPKSIYEKIVCYADKLADGKRKCTIDYSIERFGKWLGEDYRKKVIRFDKSMKKLIRP